MKKSRANLFCALVIVLCTAMLCAACGEQTGRVEESQSIDESTVQIANPFESCETLDEAIELAGFEMTAPESAKEGFDEREIRAIKGQVIEIIYKNGSERITVRKGAGTDDISGDYNEYETIAQANVGETKAVLKINGEAVMAATWTTEEHAFAITTTDGMSEKEALAIIKAVI